MFVVDASTKTTGRDHETFAGGAPFVNVGLAKVVVELGVVNGACQLGSLALE